jgi:hypothetical protein
MLVPVGASELLMLEATTRINDELLFSVVPPEQCSGVSSMVGCPTPVA